MKDSFLKLRVSEEEYVKFQSVCESKNKTMSEVLRSFITSYSNSENLILLNVDKDILKNTTELCKEKKIRFNDLVKYLLDKAIKNKDKINLSK
jgi:antitoxin component of RelBE/YafQ-DinJ toxin-antitoxin module